MVNNFASPTPPPNHHLLGAELLNLLPDFLILIDANHRILEWNRRAELVFGYKRATVLHQDLNTLIFHEPFARQRFAQLLDHLQETPYWEGELGVNLSDGEQAWFLVRVQKHFLLDGSEGILIQNAYFRDYEVRDKKIQSAIDASQKELIDVLMAVGDVVCAYDMNENMLQFISPSCELLTGYTDLEFMEQPRLLREMTSIEDMGLLDNAFALARTGLVQAVEYRIRRKDGKIIWLRNSMTPRNSAEGKTSQVICVMNDTTVHHELSDLKSRMIQMASHDLNHPLSIASGFFQLLTEDLTPIFSDAQLLYATRIRDAHQRMAQMLAELLTLEQIESQTQLEMQLIDLTKLAQAVLGEYTAQMETQQHQVRVDFPTKLVLVRGAEVHLRHAIGNLLSNAIKYTAPQGIIAVRVFAESERGGIEISDNGYGVPPSFHTKLFKPFTRAKQPGTEHIKGTGLGLSLVKAIIDHHQGEVFYRAGANGGSIFGFWLPAAH